jgi:hypothetical protein
MKVKVMQKASKRHIKKQQQPAHILNNTFMSAHVRFSQFLQQVTIQVTGNPLADGKAKQKHIKTSEIHRNSMVCSTTR